MMYVCDFRSAPCAEQGGTIAIILFGSILIQAMRRYRKFDAQQRETAAIYFLATMILAMGMYILISQLH